MHVLRRVHDLDLLPQLGDDGARPPAVFQSQILVDKQDPHSIKRTSCSLAFHSIFVRIKDLHTWKQATRSDRVGFIKTQRSLT